MKIDKETCVIFGCGGGIFFGVLTLILAVQSAVKGAGEYDVSEKTKKVLAYDPEPLLMKVEELLPFQDRVFEEDESVEGVSNPMYIRNVNFAEFQKLNQEKAMSIFNYEQDGLVVVLKFRLRILDDGILYLSSFEKKSEQLPEKSEFVGVEYLGNGEFRIDHKLDENISSLILTLLIVAVNVFWIGILSLVLFQGYKALEKKDLEIQEQKDIALANG